MTAAFRREHPQITFLTLALLVNICVGVLPRRPATELAGCVDMTALYYWLIVRPGLRPKGSKQKRKWSISI